MSYKYKLYAAILGDLCGQPYERGATIPKIIDIYNPLSRITDDTIMTLAGAECINKNGKNVGAFYKKWGKLYPVAGYGRNFGKWLIGEKTATNNSYGNGCLMRLSPFIYIDDLSLMMKSVTCSHDSHMSIHSCMKLYNAYNGVCKPTTFPKIQKWEALVSEAHHTVDFCINLFHQTQSTKEAILKAVECGGDTDTDASITGELMNYFMHDITKEDAEYVESKLDNLQLRTLREFNK